MQVPPEQTSNPPSPNAQLRAVVPHNLEFKAAILLLFLVALIAGSVAYLMYARGAFEATQELVLLADDSDGVSVGMDLTFSGFPVGRITVSYTHLTLPTTPYV